MPEPASVLMLSAVAAQFGGPDSSEEQRQVDQAIRAARYRDGLILHTAQAVQGGDILSHLLNHDPTVLHFSGHASDSGLRVLTPDGGDAPLVTKGLAELLAAVGGKVQLVVLNACGTDSAARDLAQAAGCAIGYPGKVADSTAIAFATNFYRCIGDGLVVGRAFHAAIAVIRMYGVSEAEIPNLYLRPGLDRDTLTLLHPTFQPPPAEQRRALDPTGFLAHRTGAKNYTALVTGSTDSIAQLRTELASRNIDIQWIQVERTVESS